jgi:hypothetical protein
MTLRWRATTAGCMELEILVLRHELANQLFETLVPDLRCYTLPLEKNDQP